MTLIRTPKPLETAAEVFAALGENPGVIAITGATPQEVSNWKSRGWFPSNTWLQFEEALRAIGLTASRKLWRMRAPARGCLPKPSSRGKRCG